MIGALSAYTCPVAAGFLAPFLLARREGPERWRDAILGIGAAALVAAVGLLSGGKPFRQMLLVEAYIVSLGLWFGGLFEGLRLTGASRAAAQVVSGLALTAMIACLFLGRLILGDAPEKAQADRAIWWISQASPVIVVSTILGDDPIRNWPGLYDTGLADYGTAASDLPLVLGFFSAAGAALLGASAARDRRKRAQNRPSAGSGPDDHERAAPDDKAASP